MDHNDNFHTAIEKKAQAKDVQGIALWARPGAAAAPIINKLVELASKPGFDKTEIYYALANAAGYIGDVSRDWKIAGGAKSSFDARNALLGAITFLRAENNPHAATTARQIIQSCQIYSWDRIDKLVYTGKHDLLVPLIEHHGEVGAYQPELDAEKAKLLAMIGSDEALAAMGRIALRTAPKSIDIIESLGESGEQAVPVLEDISKTQNLHKAIAAYKAIEGIEGDAAREAESRVKTELVSRLLRLQHVASQLVSINAEPLSQDDKKARRKTLFTDKREENSFTQWPHEAVMQVVMLGELNRTLAIATLNDLWALSVKEAGMVLINMARTEKACRPQIYAVLQDKNIGADISKLLDLPEDDEEAFKLWPHLIAMKHLDDRQLAGFLQKYPAVEADLFVGTEPADPATFDLALRIAKHIPAWVPVLFNAFEQAPADTKAFSMLRHCYHHDHVDAMFDLFTAINEPYAVHAVASMVESFPYQDGFAREKERVVARAVQYLRETLLPDAAQALAQIGRKYPDFELPCLNALILKKATAPDEEAAALVSRVAVPLIEKMANPTRLYKDLPKKGQEGYATFLAASFARAEQAGLLPDAPVSLTAMFGEIAENIAQRAHHAETHKALFPGQGPQ